MTAMHDNASELLPLVDEEGRTVGRATRGLCHGGSRLLHPVVHLHVVRRADGALYLQRRPDWKDVQPGRWDTAVGGHVAVDEPIADALRREALEELRLGGFEAVPVARYVFESAVERELVHVFRTVTDAEPQPTAELDGGRFFTYGELRRRLATDFFTPNFEQEWLRFLAADMERGWTAAECGG